MKATRNRHIVHSTLAAALLLSASAQAQISGINVGTSSASIQFDDTNSTVPPAGTTNVTQSTGPWAGVPTFALSVLPDPITADFATGDITATFAGSNYMVALNNIQLSQVNATAGFALLVFQFTVEYTLASALPLQATLFPNFLISGTVGTGGGSLAAMTGSIDYYDVTNASYSFGLLDTVNYNYLNLIPGPFVNAPVNGVPVNGFTPLIPVGSNLTLVGNFTFKVDPSSLSGQSYAAPEPSVCILALAAGLPLLLRRRRA